MNEYFARSASDKTENWPFWFVAKRNAPGFNVLPRLADAMGLRDPKSGAVLAPRAVCEKIAEIANKDGVKV